MPRPSRHWIVWLALALTTWGLYAISRAIAEHCAFGFGGFQCNDWLANRYGAALALQLALLVAAPVLLGIAVVRAIRSRARRK